MREQWALIDADPARYDCYHALLEIYAGAQWVDAATCVASTLAFLKKATPEALAWLDQHRPPDLVAARQRLSDEALREQVFHPELDPVLTEAMGGIAERAANPLAHYESFFEPNHSLGSHSISP